MASHSLLSLHLPKPSAFPRFRASSASTIQSPPQSLEERFGRKGIKFYESGDVVTVELTVRNGSSLRLRIPEGIVTSYKPKVYWKDDGFEEVLYTIGDGVSSVKGGLGLVLNDVSRDGSAWSASEWVVKDADSDSIDAVQVELSCTHVDGHLDITYVVSLYPLSMATAVIVQNNGTESVKLTSGMLGHIRFKSQGRSAIQGLRGCSYCSHPPLASSFGILSPSDAMEPEPPGRFSFLGSPSQEKVSTEINEPEAWKVEDDLYTILKRKLSRVYAAPPSERTKRIYNTSPSKYQTIDQGSGLGFRVIRMGYEDIYIGSPGSLSKKYGKDYFICTGSASMLVPEVLDPGAEWRAAQVELISTSPNGKMEAKCLVTLRVDLISSELTVTNSTPSFIQLQGGIMTHLTVSTPDATYVVGLQGSNYCRKQATASQFSIIPPADSTKHESSSPFIRSLAQKGFDGLFSGWGTKKHQDEETKEEEEKEECSDYAPMEKKLSRIYTCTPVEFTVIDRGRRNSVVIQRNGFEELYMFSPGSDHDWYGKYAFVCVGPYALLKPIVLGPGGIWKGAQCLYNPNL